MSDSPAVRHDGSPRHGRVEQGQRRGDEPGDVDELFEGGDVVFGGSEYAVDVGVEDPGRQRWRAVTRTGYGFSPTFSA
jgi:hypothetical protein